MRELVAVITRHVAEAPGSGLVQVSSLAFNWEAPKLLLLFIKPARSKESIRFSAVDPDKETAVPLRDTSLGTIAEARIADGAENPP